MNLKYNGQPSISLMSLNFNIPTKYSLVLFVLTIFVGLYIAPVSCYLNEIVPPYKSDYWNLRGVPGDGYYIAVQIGTPPQKFNVLVDTGSSNFAIAGAPHKKLSTYFKYDNSSTYISDHHDLKLEYSQSWWKGYLCKDLVKFPILGLSQPILTDLAVITESENFFVIDSNWQGILGLAYLELSKAAGYSLPWFDTLTNINESITQNAFSLELCGVLGSPTQETHYGRMAIGLNESNCHGSQFSTPINHELFYEVTVVSMSVGDHILELHCQEYNTERTIVDSGTSNLRLPPKVFEKVVNQLKIYVEELQVHLPNEFWETNSGQCWPKNNDKWKLLPNISITLAHTKTSSFVITLGPQSYLRRPTTEVQNPNAFKGDCWAFGIESANSETVLGAAVLEGLCVTFDRANKLILFQKSLCGPPVTISGFYNFTNVCSCTYTPSRVNGVAMTAYIMAAILSLLCIPLIIAAGWWFWYTKSPSSSVRSQLPFRSTTHTRLPFHALDENPT